ncbi:unnamed protein product [Rotaria sp. Silwood2]|nr:unnamed protein product [Rotaria sp. Silwood2]CAF4281379.1 unnamed protein product [Rotaria sp. Silwood2]
MSSSKMPDEHYYTSEQIPISPELPDILLQFSKVVIRTQLTDVLAWSLSPKGTLPLREIRNQFDDIIQIDIFAFFFLFYFRRMIETSISSSISNDNDNHSSTNKQTSCFARSRWAHVLALVDQLRLNTKLKKQ